MLTVQNFETKALQLFQYQAKNNLIYKQFIQYLGVKPNQVNCLLKIPFLPIELFKNHQITCKPFNKLNKNSIIFTSSGTSGTQNSQHFITNVQNYKKSSESCFFPFYGNPSNYCFLALLPSYLEKNNSSLVYMMQHFMKKANPKSGFFLNNYDQLSSTLTTLEAQNKPTILIGVSFALLNYIESGKAPKLKNTIVMETGGMKGKRKELIRAELHKQLCNGFGVQQIHSEYGMTEMLSQAYAKKDGFFYCPPSLKILIRNLYDPLEFLSENEVGAINIIDLNNRFSCAFIASNDLGKTYANGSFEVLGRCDNADLRGCNLLINT